MDLDKGLRKSSFYTGTRIKTDVLRKNNDYFESKLKITLLTGVGYGILEGYKNSLRLSIEGNLLVVSSGAAIDKKGNLIYLSEPKTVKQDISLINFKDKSTTYIYIRYEEKDDNLQDDKNKQQKVYFDVVSTSRVEISSNRYEDDSWIEVGRIHVNSNIARENDIYNVSEPLNPFAPMDNELDMSHVPKVKTNLIDISHDDRDRVTTVLLRLAEYLNDISYKYKLFTASTASALLYHIKSVIANDIVSPSIIYDNLRLLIYTVYKIKDEKPEIINSDFWGPIERIKDLINIKRSSQFHSIDYNNLRLENPDSYFSTIISLFDRSAQCSRELDIVIVKEEPKEVIKDFVQVGRSDDPKYGNDIVIGNDPIDRTVSRVHLKVKAYGRGGFFIEDMSSLGTFVNGVKIKENEKKFVKIDDSVVLGKENTKLNLNDPKIQALLNQ
jgi:hypothetical protein